MLDTLNDKYGLNWNNPDKYVQKVSDYSHVMANAILALTILMPFFVTNRSCALAIETMHGIL
jgi:hypothetical protein